MRSADAIDRRIVAEGTLIWTRYNVMVAVNALFAGLLIAAFEAVASGDIPRSLIAPFLPWLCLFAISFVVLWLGLTRAAWNLQGRLVTESLRLNPKGPYREREPAIRRSAEAVIWLFIAFYIFAFVAAVSL